MADKVVPFNKKSLNNILGKKDKTGNAKQETDLTNVLCRQVSDLPFHKIADYRLWFSGNDSMIVQVRDEGCELMKPANVASKLFMWFNNSIVDEDSDKISIKSATSAVQAWSNHIDDFNQSIISDPPAIFKFKSQKGLTFCRVGYDPIVPDDVAEKCPTFVKMISRMGNSKAFVQKVGSMFDDDGMRKQSLWLWGPTNGGKSVVQSLLSKMVGGERACVTFTPADMRGQFWKQPLVGKKIWMVREARATFLNTPEYKSLTGDGAHLINPKNAPAFHATLEGHMVFASNEEPEVERDDAVIDRIIPVHMKAIEEEGLLEEKELWRRLDAEIPYIAGYCISEYEKTGKKKIACDKGDIYDAIAHREADISEFFDVHFKVDENCVRSGARIDSEAFLGRLGFGKSDYNNKTVRAMRKFMKDRYDIKPRQYRRTPNEARNTWYEGLNWRVDVRDLNK